MTPANWNEWRVVPRLLLASWSFFVGFAWLKVFNWFTTIPFGGIESDTVALAIAAFPAAILGVLTTNLATLTNNYFRTGSLNGGNGGGS